MSNDVENVTEQSNQDMDNVTEETLAETPKAKRAAKEKTTPAWIAFTEGVRAHLDAEGLSPEVEVQKGFVQYRNPETGQKLYIAKQGRTVTRVESTLDMVGTLDAAYPLSGIGKITCSIEPTEVSVVEALRLLMTSTEKLRPSVRAAKAPTEETADASDETESASESSADESPAA